MRPAPNVGRSRAEPVEAFLVSTLGVRHVHVPAIAMGQPRNASRGLGRRLVCAARRPARQAHQDSHHEEWKNHARPRHWRSFLGLCYHFYQLYQIAIKNVNNSHYKCKAARWGALAQLSISSGRWWLKIESVWPRTYGRKTDCSDVTCNISQICNPL
jgi:hypothetical protein